MKAFVAICALFFATLSQNCPAVPSNPNYAANTKLPDPFKFIGDGSTVKTKADWACRQAEISKLAQQYELGTFPDPPTSVKGTANGNTLNIDVTANGKSISFSVAITKPSGNGPFPAIIGIGGISIPSQSGVATITFKNDEFAAQQDQSSRGKGKFYDLFGSGHSAGALTAWAWGVGRVIDALEQVPSLGIDTAHLGVTGCSRNGKGAFIVGALNPRIALTIPQESGSGGSCCWRISDDMKSHGTDTQTASQIVGENVWFSGNFNSSVNKITSLPFDHHSIAGLIAPRGLLIIENTGIDWLGPKSSWGCMNAANKIWQAVGAGSNMGMSQVGNHDHCSFPSSQNNDLAAFVNKFLKGGNDNTSILKTDGANQLGYKDADWIDWAVPNIQ